MSDQDPSDSAESRGDSAPAPDTRSSVATEREATGRRSTLILGGISLLLLTAGVIVGFILNSQATAVPEDGYGTSTRSVATVDADGVITVGAADAAIDLDVYQDALCELCGEFERQYGQQIAKALDDGALQLHYRMVDFYNPASASGDYSTRAYAALLTVVEQAGDDPGVVMTFYASLYADGTQPEEDDTSDLTNQQLADLATQAGAPEVAAAEIAAGSGIAAAADDAASHIEELKQVWGDAVAGMDTPTIIHNGQMIVPNDVEWLTTLLASAA